MGKFLDKIKAETEIGKLLKEKKRKTQIKDELETVKISIGDSASKGGCYTYFNNIIKYQETIDYLISEGFEVKLYNNVVEVFWRD